MSLHFVKPSLRRIIWSMIVVAVACCVVISSAYVIGALVAPGDDPAPTSPGEYVMLAVVFLTFWSPSLLLNFWYLSLPVIIVVGLLIASLRRREAHPPR